jgi:hypothetical protein
MYKRTATFLRRNQNIKTSKPGGASIEGCCVRSVATIIMIGAEQEENKKQPTFL